MATNLLKNIIKVPVCLLCYVLKIDIYLNMFCITTAVFNKLYCLNFSSIIPFWNESVWIYNYVFIKHNLI